MGSELIYRGHDEAEPESDIYSPKPMKPWTSALVNPIQYLLKENRFVFVLIGIAIASLFFSLLPSSSSPPSNYPIADYSRELISSSDNHNNNRFSHRATFLPFNTAGTVLIMIFDNYCFGHLFIKICVLVLTFILAVPVYYDYIKNKPGFIA